MIGKGAFGSVHRAVSLSKQSHGQSVAIKMIDKKLMKAARMSKRVANEVELHWQLHHPSILELLNYFEDDKYVYLVTELCDRGELFRWMQKNKQEGRLSEEEAKYVMHRVIEGLLYLHGNSIIHRDLKLSNLLLTESFQVKIADFGLAVRLNEPKGEQQTMCGTPNYISPEIVHRQPYGLSADIWSLGCMLVTMLTGSPPFDSVQVQDTLHKVSKLDFSLPSYISPFAKHLILSLLQRDPTKRPTLEEIKDHPFLKNCLGNPFETGYTFVSKASSNKSFKQLSLVTQHSLPVFDTKRLKPLIQKTKHGQVEILENGNVLVHFDQDPVDLLISADSTTIESSNTKKVYNRDNLPAEHYKKYKYVSKFIELVKSKTPKIVFYSPQAKCLLMENSPMADFEMIFYNKTKVHHSAAKKKLTMSFEGKQVVIDMSNHSEKVALKPEFIPIFKHAQECLKQCIQIEKTVASEPHTSYPVILKSSQCWTSQKSLVSTKSAPSVASFHPSCMSTFSTRATPSVVQKPKSTARSSTISTLNQQLPPRIPSRVEHPDPLVQTAFINGVGHCLRMSCPIASFSTKFVMMFNDGIVLTVQKEPYLLSFENCIENVSVTYSISNKVPIQVKEKLAYFRNFMSILSKKQ